MNNWGSIYAHKDMWNSIKHNSLYFLFSSFWSLIKYWMQECGRTVDKQGRSFDPEERKTQLMPEISVWLLSKQPVNWFPVVISYVATPGPVFHLFLSFIYYIYFITNLHIYIFIGQFNTFFVVCVGLWLVLHIIHILISLLGMNKVYRQVVPMFMFLSFLLID